jgi:hypothetical protein
VGKSRFTAIRYSPFAVRTSPERATSRQLPATSQGPRTAAFSGEKRMANGDSTRKCFLSKILPCKSNGLKILPGSPNGIKILRGIWGRGYKGRHSLFAIRQKKLPAPSFQLPAQTCYRRIRLAAGSWELAATNCRSLDSPLPTGGVRSG